MLLGAVLSPVLTTCGAQIVEEFKITFNQYALLSGWALLTSACSAWLAQASARIWGKRPTYIVATLLLFATTIWSSRVTSYGSFVGARALEGIGNGPFESIVLSSVGDLYFASNSTRYSLVRLILVQVHQRGKRIMFYNMMTLSTVSFSPIIGGYITEKHGWRMQFYIIAGFLFLGIFLLVLACPEHAYSRPLAYETDVVAGEAHTINGQSTPSENESMTEKPKSYLQELKPYSNNVSGEKYLVLLARPFVCMLYPAVVWAFFLGGCWSTWVSSQTACRLSAQKLTEWQNAAVVIILSQLFSTPPNLFSPSELGYIYTFPFIGSIIAYFLGSLAADSTAKRAARRNNGLFEPEYRQWLTIPAFFVGIPGLFAFGYYATERDITWVLVSFIYGLIVFATVFSSASAYAYILDSHRNLSVEVSVAYVMLRNLFWFGASYFMPTWLETSGAPKTFYIMAGIQAGITLISIAAYIYGKISRDWIHRHDPLKFLGLI